jgi:hypothetical protein
LTVPAFVNPAGRTERGYETYAPPAQPCNFHTYQAIAPLSLTPINAAHPDCLIMTSGTVDSLREYGVRNPAL